MLFSCVVDADFLDTEAFFEPGKRQYVELPQVRELLDDFTLHAQEAVGGPTQW